MSSPPFLTEGRCSFQNGYSALPALGVVLALRVALLPVAVGVEFGARVLVHKREKAGDDAHQATRGRAEP